MQKEKQKLTPGALVTISEKGHPHDGKFGIIAGRNGSAPSFIVRLYRGDFVIGDFVIGDVVIGEDSLHVGWKTKPEETPEAEKPLVFGDLVTVDNNKGFFVRYSVEGYPMIQLINCLFRCEPGEVKRAYFHTFDESAPVGRRLMLGHPVFCNGEPCVFVCYTYSDAQNISGIELRGMHSTERRTVPADSVYQLNENNQTADEFFGKTNNDDAPLLDFVADPELTKSYDLNINNGVEAGEALQKEQAEDAARAAWYGKGEQDKSCGDYYNRLIERLHSDIEMLENAVLVGIDDGEDSGKLAHLLAAAINAKYMIRKIKKYLK